MQPSIDRRVEKSRQRHPGAPAETSPMSVARTGRRDFLRTALGAGAGVSFACFAGTPVFARTKADPILVTPVTDTIALVTGAGSNVVILTKPEGVVMIDGGLAEHSGDLAKTIAKHAKGARPQMLFNTHWHWDHTGSNERLGKAGTKIIA